MNLHALLKSLAHRFSIMTVSTTHMTPKAGVTHTVDTVSCLTIGHCGND